MALKKCETEKKKMKESERREELQREGKTENQEVGQMNLYELVWSSS